MALWGVDIRFNGQYYDKYSVRQAFTTLGNSNAVRVLTQGSETVPSQTYFDMSLSYVFNEGAGAYLKNTKLTIGIQNIFNREPPIAAPIADADFAYSPYGDPRLRRFTLTVRKSF